MAGCLYGNLKNKTMYNRKPAIEGNITLYDYNFEVVVNKIYKSKKARQEIINYWEKYYRLQDKKYYLIITPKI
jgi:hypothetical protein